MPGSLPQNHCDYCTHTTHHQKWTRRAGLFQLAYVIGAQEVNSLCVIALCILRIYYIPVVVMCIR